MMSRPLLQEDITAFNVYVLVERPIKTCEDKLVKLQGEVDESILTDLL